RHRCCPTLGAVMVKFSAAPVIEVAPKKKSRQPSKRAVIQADYQHALNRAIDSGEALIVEMEPVDKALTIRNRIYIPVTLY
ncbi:MAG TPA: hypothetical protein VF221_04600, partial [Chloroflexota bacterium]